MVHGKAMAVVTAYNIYLECYEGKLDPSWKTEPVDFFPFREKLSYQLPKYCPSNCKYAGDEKFRDATRVPKQK